MTPTNSDELKPFPDEIWIEETPNMRPWNTTGRGEKYTRASRPDPAPVCDGKAGESIEIIKRYLDDYTNYNVEIELMIQKAGETLITAAKEAEALKERVKVLEKRLGVQFNGYDEIDRLRAELAKQPERVSVEQLEQIVNDEIDEHVAFTPIGQRHATLFILEKRFPHGIVIVEDK